MIVNEKIDRFATNWGVIPTSIDLAPDYTTKIDAMNIELSGPNFSKESDFGNGLNGVSNFSNSRMMSLMGLGDVAPTTTGFLPVGSSLSLPGTSPIDTSSLLSSSSLSPSLLSSGFSFPSIDFSTWTWEDYLLVAGLGFTVYQVFFGAKATSRRAELRSAEEGYRRRRKKIKEDYSFSPFASPKRRRSSK